MMKFKKVLSVMLVFIMAMTVFLIPEGSSADSNNEDAVDNQIIAPTTVIVGQKFIIKAKGDKQETDLDRAGTPGEVAYVPYAISMTGSYPIDEYYGNDIDYEPSFDGSYYYVNAAINRSAIETITVTYCKYTYSTTHSWNGSYCWGIDSYIDKSVKISSKGLLKFNGNGGKVAYGSTYLLSGAERGAVPTVKRKGYKLMGWYPSKKSRKKIYSTTKIYLYDEYGNYKAKTIYAKWTKREKVKFNANKGRVGKKNKTVRLNYKYGKLPTPKRNRCKFKGWYTQKVGGKRVTKNTYVSKTKRHTLYAHWLGPKGYGRTITKAEFKRIHNGMSYNTVKWLIGGSGNLISSYESYDCYMWRGNGSYGSNAEIYFDEYGEVYAKAQSGLR